MMKLTNSPEVASDDWYYGLERREMLAYVDPSVKKVLEIGCGAGEFGRLVKQKTGAEYWGIELNETVGLAARENIDSVRIGDVREHIHSLPKGEFDLIVCNDVLEHMQDPYELLKLLRCLISPGGKLLASIPNIRFVYALKHIVLEKDFRYADNGIFDRTHLRFFTRNSIRRMFLEAGYDVSVLNGFIPNYIPRGRAWKLVNALSFLDLFEDMRHFQYACVCTPSPGA